MRIGIDIRVLGAPYKSGVEEYTENLLAHMLTMGKDVTFKLFYSGDGRRLRKYPWINLDNVELIKSPFSNKLFFTSSYLFGYPKIDDLLGGVEVFLSPHFLISPLNNYCRRVMVFHDLSYLRFKDFFSLRRNLWHNFQTHSFGDSFIPDKIIAVSESTKKDLTEKYGIEPDRIEIIYSGLAENISQPSPKEIEDFRTKNNLPKHFILFLGKLEPRKNIVSLIKAFEILKEKNNFDDLHLIIAGAKGWLFKDIFRAAAKSPFRSKIIFKDYIADSEKKFYYSLASVFVYASFFEGFGFPPLEAMACGTPVVVSSNSSLPEVVGEAGILIDPYSVVDISSAIEKVLTDPVLSERLIMRGRQRVRDFTWRRCANQTLNCLQSF